MTTISLMLQCNHWRDGAFKGVCSQVAIDDTLTLNSPWCDSSLKVEIQSRRLRLGNDHWFPILGHSEWCGNWCWNAVSVTHATAADVLNFVVAKGYRPESGWIVLWDKIDRKEPFTAAALIAEGVGSRP